ncbi:hypothetical protein [Streptomyces sp. NPDC001380]|uniref:hypothetical protein n=1 Tax=Streptomyces sp. NPDC001380 TaxID=3364566 RepID=UPI0036B08F51
MTDRRPTTTAVPTAAVTAAAAVTAPVGRASDRAAAPGEGGAARSRPRLRAALRWGAAVLVLGLSGTAAALAVAAPDRTDLPGLRTPSDGRYAFPPASLPPLPAGRPAPFSSAGDGRHWADLRGLLLPAPRQAVGPAVPASSGPAGKECAAFAALFADPAAIGRSLREEACRRGTGRSWTTAGGTRTEIRLVGFASADEAQAFHAAVIEAEPARVRGGIVDTTDDFTVPPGTNLNAASRHEGPAGRQRTTARAAYLRSGDTVGVVLMTDPRGVPDTAFRQVVSDQAGLLG